MAELGGTFDSTQVDPAAPVVPLPTAWYAMTICASEKKLTAKGDAKYLKLQLKIDEKYHPELKGRCVWDNLNLWNPNEQTRDISQAALSSICRAVEIPKPNNSDQLHDKTLAVRVAYRPARGEWGETNDVKGYEPIGKHFGPDGTRLAGAPAGGAPTAPVASAPAASTLPKAPAAPSGASGPVDSVTSGTQEAGNEAPAATTPDGTKKTPWS